MPFSSALRRVFILGLLIMISTTVGSSNLFALEPPHIKKSIRAMGMGEAFLSVSNDESALFYNPAGLNQVKAPIIELVSANVTFNQTVFDLLGTKNFQEVLQKAISNDFSFGLTSALDTIVGNKVYLEVDANYLSYTRKNFGWSLSDTLLVNGDVNNPVVPSIDVNAYHQQARMIGISGTFFDGEILGATYKSIFREGVEHEYHLADMLQFDDFIASLNDLFRKENKQAFDVGWIHPLGDLGYFENSQVALVVQNVGGLDFKYSQDIPQTIGVGWSSLRPFGEASDLLFSVDYVDIQHKTTPSESRIRNLRMGIEYGIWPQANGHHALSVRVGAKGVYSSFGFSVNPKYIPLKLDYAMWNEDVGEVAGGKMDSRKAIQLSMQF